MNLTLTTLANRSKRFIRAPRAPPPFPLALPSLHVVSCWTLNGAAKKQSDAISSSKNCSDSQEKCWVRDYEQLRKRQNFRHLPKGRPTEISSASTNQPINQSSEYMNHHHLPNQIQIKQHRSCAQRLWQQSAHSFDTSSPLKNSTPPKKEKREPTER